MPTLPKIELPKLDLPKIEIPKALPKVELPKVEIPKSFPKPKAPAFDLNLPVSPKPLYAGAGVADLAVQAVREYAVGVQKRVEDYRTDATARFTDARKSVASFEPKVLPARAKATYADFSGQTRKTVTELQADVRALPGKAKAKLDETTASANDAYQGLAKRGEVFVAKLRGKPAPAPVKRTATATAANKAPATKAPATKAPATKTAAKKAPAKKAPAKTTAAKKAPAKKAPAKTTAAKNAPARKAPAKTTAASSATKTTSASTAKKSTAKKA